MSNIRLIGEAPSYSSNASKIVACRRWADADSKLEMLRSLGFSCKLERHCGFWLIHYQLPKIRLVGGRPE